jgi:membrane protease YdiL (CAAX protease family)
MSQKIPPSQRALSLWGAILGIWAIYRHTIGANTPMLFDELLLKPLLFLWPVYLFITQYERRKFLHSVWLKPHAWLEDVEIAFAMGLPLLCAVCGLLYMGHTGEVTWSVGMLFLWVVVSISTAVTEETLSRGFVTSRLFEDGQKIVTTIVHASLLHVFLRIPRIMTMPELFGTKLIVAFVAEIIVSMVMTTIFVWRRNLLPVIVVRALYTLGLLTLFGVSVW